MAFQVSPGVQVREIDLTNVVPAVATSIGAIAGSFEKGPVDEVVAISSEQDLVNVFGKPNSSNFENWFTAANFLQYGNALRIVRVNNGAITSTASGGATVGTFSGDGSTTGFTLSQSVTDSDLLVVTIDDVETTAWSVTGTTLTFDSAPASGSSNVVAKLGVRITNEDFYDANYADGQGSVGSWSARTPGSWGNSLGVAICGSANAYENSSATGVISTSLTGDGSTVAFTMDESVPNDDEDLVAVTVGGTATTAFTLSGTTITFDSAPASAAAIVVTLTRFRTTAAANADTTTVSVTDGDLFNVGDIVYFQETSGQQYEVTAISTNDLTIRQLDNPNGGGLKTAVAEGTAIRRRWRFYDLFDAAPGTSTWATGQGLSSAQDEMHVVIYDTTGGITSYDVDVAGNRTQAVVETWSFVSKHPFAKTAQGGTNYYVDVINAGSEYVWWMDHPTSGTDWGTNLTSAGTDTTFVAGDLPIVDTLSNGKDDYSETVGELSSAYDLLSDSETVDINLVLAGKSPDSTDGITHATNIIDLVEGRKDAVAFISPRRADVVGVTSSITQTSNIKGFFDNLSSSSYAVFDSGYKYMYDKYNDVYRYVPLNGDIAGLAANTDNVADPWFSPAGFNRGQIRGSVKLAYNPTKAQRDILYPARVNPVCTFPGQGTVLFGDKTALSRPSAFDRINVRRLFIVLEKAISTAAKFQLFEFNDEFTRAQFRNLVEPFLRDVQGRRGITDFSVVADGTNNTGEVIDRNEFVADIYIKPARSINFITLNFIATRTGVAFSEIGG